jgi:hypothetical protein
MSYRISSLSRYIQYFHCHGRDFCTKTCSVVRVLSSAVLFHVVQWKSTSVSEEDITSICLHHIGLLLYFVLQDGADSFPLKEWFTFTRLHHGISHNIDLFVATAVRTACVAFWHSVVPCLWYAKCSSCWDVTTVYKGFAQLWASTLEEHKSWVLLS